MSGEPAGAPASQEEPPDFLREQHVAFVVALDSQRDSLEHAVTEHLRMSGVYWGLAALETLGRGDALDKRRVVEFVRSCAHDGGGYGGGVGHDPHLLYTLSALQLLAMCDALGEVDAERTAAYVAGLQRPDGSFAGDAWGEVDTRFSYIALQSLALLGRLDAVNVPRAAEFVLSCANFDGGFGAVPGAESHAGQVFCCVAALAIAGAVARVDADQLGWWLAERQVDSGGLNGRPEKQSDVCYSWWILSALSILGRTAWIDRTKLARFILDCQDPGPGGIADRPGNMADVFHTFFGIAGLSLLGWLGGEAAGRHQPIDPVYALPARLVERLRLPRTVLPPPPASEADALDGEAGAGGRITAGDARGEDDDAPKAQLV
jgi:geranylgeranyl transferase type-2 subunit beta